MVDSSGTPPVSLPCDTDSRGITKVKDGKWEVRVSIGGKNTYLNRFDTVEDAIACRDMARASREPKAGRKSRAKSTRVMTHGVHKKHDGLRVRYNVEVYHRGARHYGGRFDTYEPALVKAQEIKARLVAEAAASAPACADAPPPGDASPASM